MSVVLVWSENAIEIGLNIKNTWDSSTYHVMLSHLPIIIITPHHFELPRRHIHILTNDLSHTEIPGNENASTAVSSNNRAW